MLPRADLNSARPVGPVEPVRPTDAIGDARQELNQRLNNLVLGKMYQAQVLTRLKDDSFMVKLADTPLRMNLPPGTQVGGTVDLKFIAGQPRPTFLLQPPPVGSGSLLSSTGRLIDSILRTVQKEGAPASLVGKAPLVGSSSTPPAQLATAMKDTLTFSGLFYESHVRQWASGERPLSDLMREPQAAKSNPALVSAALHSLPSGEAPDLTGATGNTAVAVEAAGPDQLQADAADAQVANAATTGKTVKPEDANISSTPKPGADNGASESAETVPAKAGGTPGDSAASGARVTSGAHSDAALLQVDTTPLETIDSEAARMISLQLDTLEHRRVAWQGELWPGQQMEWEVTEESHGSATENGAERAWQSVVRVELPHLGSISAAIRLSGDRLQVQLRAADDATAAALRSHGDELAASLAAAGSTLDMLTVKQDASA